MFYWVIVSPAGRGVPDHLEAGTVRQTGHRSPEKGPPRRGGALHQNHHHTAFLCGIRKAPISQPTKARGYESLDEPRGPGKSIIAGSPLKSKEENMVKYTKP